LCILDDQQSHSYSNQSVPTHRGATAQLHPKTHSFPYRSSASRRSHTESSPLESTTTRIETRSQRARAAPTLPHSRTKHSGRLMLDEMTSTSSDAITLSTARGRIIRPTGSTAIRHLTSDSSVYHTLASGFRPRGSTPMYVPMPQVQSVPHTLAASAPAPGSLLMSTSIPTKVIQQTSHMNLSSYDKSKLKEWIQKQAQHFRANYFADNSTTSNIALEVIHRLAAAVDLLQVGKDQNDNMKALRDIAHILAKGDVSPFEIVHSGLITKLFQYLTDDISIPNDRFERLKIFLNIFVQIPVENRCQHDKELKKFIMELHQTQLHHEKSSESVLYHLISKLHGCINQLEQFPIRGINKRDLHRTTC
jgi:hypothetical protein